MRRTLLRRVVDSVLAPFGNAPRRQRRLRHLQSRHAFLESLEDRRLMATGVTIFSGGLPESGTNQIKYLEGGTSPIGITLRFTRTTSESATGGAGILNSDDDLGTIAITAASSGFAWTSLSNPSSSGANTQIVSFEFNSGVTTGDITLTFTPNATDDDSTDDTVSFGPGYAPYFSFTGGTIHQREAAHLSLLAQTVDICPACNCCQGDSLGAAAVSSIQTGPVALTHQQTDLFQPTLVAQALLPNGATDLRAVLKVGYYNGSSWQTATSATSYFSTSGSTGNSWFQFTMPVPNTDGTNPLPTGGYHYQLDVTTGGTTAVGSIMGEVAIVDPTDQDVGLGKGWSLSGVGRLILADSSPGGGLNEFDAATSRGVFLAIAGSKIWFPRSGSGFGNGSGDYRDMSLEFDYANNEYLLTSPSGDVQAFAADGLLKRREDRQGNQELFTYSSGKLATYTDKSGLVTTFGYTGSDVTSITDDYGNVTTLAWSSGQITSITSPDPDGAGPLLAPKEDLSYNTDGTIATQTVWPAESNSTGGEVTTFSYSSGGRLDSIQRPNGELTEFDPSFAVSSGAGSSGSPFALTLAGDVYGYETNDDGTVTRKKYNEHGQTIETVENYVSGTYDPLTENITSSSAYYAAGDYDSTGTTLVSSVVVGKLKSTTAPDSDVTRYDYDNTSGLLTKITYADATTELFTYGTSGGALNLVTQYTDRMGNIVKYDYDSDGNKVREQRVVGAADTLDLVNDPYNLLGDDAVTTWEFGTTGANVAGLPTAMIDARGMRTEYTYTTLGQPETITTDVGDSSHDNAVQTFVYNSDDQLEREYGPLWEEADHTSTENDDNHFYVEHVYDSLGREVQTIGIDPDGDGTDFAPPETDYQFDRLGRMILVTDTLGRQTETVYSSDGLTITTIHRDSSGSHNILSSTVQHLDALGRTSDTVDALSHTTAYGYDDLGHVITTTFPDPNGNSPHDDQPVTHTSYDALGRVLTTTDALGNVTDYSYSDHGQTVTVILPAPDTGEDRPVQITESDAAGRTVQVTDSAKDGTTGTVTELRHVRYVYNDLSQVTEIWKTQPDGSGEYLAEARTYDKLGNVLTSTVTITLDGSGDPDVTATTTFEYDLRGRLIQRTDPDPDGTSPTTDQPVWTWVYNVGGQLESSTDAEGNTTDYQYDNRGLLVLTTLPDPDGAGSLGRPEYATVYDDVGRTVRSVDPLGNYTLNVYDESDNLVVVQSFDDSDNEVSVNKFGFDEAGQQLWSAYKTGTYVSGGNTYNTYAITTNTFDDLGRVTSMLLPDPDDPMYLSGEGSGTYSNSTGTPGRASLSYTFDVNGNTLTQTNEISETTTLAYDDLNRLVSRTDPTISAGTPVTSFTYDTLNRQLTLTDPEDNTTTWTYDTWDHPLTETNELNKTRSMEYDLLGQLTQKTDRLNRVTTYDHDVLGRVTAEKWWNSGVTTVIARYDFEYNLNSQLLTADGQDVANSEVWSNTTYGYNDGGSVDSLTVDQPGLLSSTLAFTYDLLARRASMQADFSVDGGTKTQHDFATSYGYDPKSRLSSLQQTVSGSGTNYSVLADKSFVFGYDQQDQLTSLQRYANLSNTQLVAQSDYIRDYLERLTMLDHYKSTTHFATYDLEYDQHHRISAIDSVFSNSAWDESDDFTYDDTDQLTAADHSVQNDEAYGYDENGNRSGSQTHLGGTTSTTVTTDNHISTDGVYNYTQDDEGNTLTKSNIATGDKQEFTWDYRNRLTKVTFKNSGGTITKTIEYRYDHNDFLLRRIETAYSAGVAGTPVHDIYVHDGPQIVLAFHKTTGNASLTNRYVWSDQIDQVLADEQVTFLSSAGTVYYVLANHQNSVVDLATYNSGINTTTIAKHRKLDVFGNVTLDSAPGVSELFAYTSMYFEIATSMTNHWHRWLELETGRWMGPDPMGFVDGENLTQFVGNKANSSTDPFGLWEKISEDVWEADGSDTFDELATIVGTSGVAKYAIRPIPPPGWIVVGIPGFSNYFVDVDQMRRKWDFGRPVACGRYDTSYLTHPPRASVCASISIGTDSTGYIVTAGKFFDANHVPDGPAAVTALGEASFFGQAPLISAWIVGHGVQGSAVIGGLDFALKLSMFKLNGRGPWDYPKWDDAVAGRLTPGFWFGKSSDTHFIGCNTDALAKSFAKNVLWDSATAWGTDTFTLAWSATEMGWGRKQGRFAVPEFKPDGSHNSAHSPSDYFAMDHWDKYPGGTQYPF